MKKLFILITVCFFFYKGFSQDSDAVNMNNESLFLHIDRSEYAAGERVWFKLMCYQKDSDNKNKTSQLVYIEVLNPMGFSVARKKVRMSESSGYGELLLPDTLSTGEYRVLAYTNWMKNFGYSGFLKSNILIYNPNKKVELTKNTKTPDDFVISTEQNDLIVDLNNRVYYKLNSEIVDSCLVSLTNEVGNIIQQYPVKKSFGYFSFIPKKDEKYSVSLISNNQMFAKKDLTESKPEGLIINLEKVTQEYARFKIQCTGLYESLINELLYSVNNSGVLNSIKLSKNTSLDISKTNLVNGKNRITFYKSDKSIIWERNFYFENETEIINLSEIKEKLNKRNLAKVKIETNSDKRDYNIVNLSVSAHKISKRKYQFKGSDQLNTEVKYIDSDIYDQNIMQLFEMENADLPEDNTNYPEFRGALLTGKILTQEGTPLAENDIFLSFPDSVVRLTITKTNKNGEFVFYINSDQYQRDLVINSNNNNKNLTILVDNNFYNRYPESKISVKNFDEDYFNELYVNYRINKLFEIENSIESSDSLISNKTYSFYEKADQIYNIKDFIKMDSIHEYFYEIVQGVKISKNKNQWLVRVMQEGSGVPYNSSPALFIDGVYFENIESILKLNPSECKRIEVVRKPVMLKNRNYDGLIAVFTNEYDLDGAELPSNSTRIEYRISDKSLEFVSEPAKEKEIPEFRNTLYWNPEVIIKAGETKAIEFYTGDDDSWYEIEIKGITDSGQEIYEHEFFKVGNP